MYGSDLHLESFAGKRFCSSPVYYFEADFVETRAKKFVFIAGACLKPSICRKGLGRYIEQCSQAWAAKGSTWPNRQ